MCFELEKIYPSSTSAISQVDFFRHDLLDYDDKKAFIKYLISFGGYLLDRVMTYFNNNFLNLFLVACVKEKLDKNKKISLISQ